MKIAVISDLHMGRGDAADRFGHDDRDFLAFLDALEADFERIVLLGDIYETLTSLKPLAQAQELQAVKRAHPEISERFESAPYHYVHGNHDLIAGDIDSAPSAFQLDVDGTNILFTHGHHHDWVVNQLRWLSESGVWAGGWLLRMGLSPMIRMFEYFHTAMAGISSDPEVCSFQRWAIASAHSCNADIVVTGHTHIGIQAEHGDRLFLNSGSCAKGNYSFLSLDTSAGQYAHHSAW